MDLKVQSVLRLIYQQPMIFSLSQQIKDKIGKISSLFRLSDHLVPLFIGVLAIILSIEASIPGRLEEHSQLPWFLIAIFLVVPINGICTILSIPLIHPIILLELFLILPFVLFAGYNIFQIVFRDRNNRTHLQLSGIFSFLIVSATILLLHFRVPAKTRFLTHQDRFQQVLADGKYTDIKQIGSIEIEDIIVRNSDKEKNRGKDIYFETVNTSDGWDGRLSYGFVYLASNLDNVDRDFRDRDRHIYGNWYIFGN